jgi:cysteine desulfurase / selenocysteine lyase
VGLEAAIDYISQIGMERVAEHGHQLILYATRLLKEIPGLRLIGAAPVSCPL